MKSKWVSRIFPAMSLAISVNVHAVDLEVEAGKAISEIRPTMYGLFFEDINFAADGGLYAELVKNRSFEFDEPLMGWKQPETDPYSLNEASGIAIPVKTAADGANRTFLRVRVNNAAGYEILNEGFRGMGIKGGERYRFTMNARDPEGKIKKVIIRLLGDGRKVIGEASVSPASKDWAGYSATIPATATDARAVMKITFEGEGGIDIDMVSLFPEDTWKRRKGGLRKDIVQLLDELEPGFLRFPGGCIVEGRNLSQRYQWKKTVGAVEDREVMINRWNTEFDHRPAEDYYQSFGLGFYEYFLLAEDLGAEPLPVLNCGMACQFNTGEVVPMGELDPYVRDALDLIEFANGSSTTGWGRLRADMGHPKPFNLKKVGIGNEQWGPDYIERLTLFRKIIGAKHPEITIVAGAGPFSDGPHFDYAMKALRKMNVEIIDEHYYKKPDWYVDNVTRYDSYDRKGPAVFVGEYAAQSVAVVSMDNRNNWETALAEAAFMTGLERNADIVHMTSYAPLLAHADAWQWTPDLIWFNSLDVYGTPNYYVQKLFSTHKGTHLITVTQDGKPVTGQSTLYASAVKDAGKQEVIVKVVNMGSEPQSIDLHLSGAEPAGEGTMIVLAGKDKDEVNSFASPRNIYPSAREFAFKGRTAAITLAPRSLTVLKLKLKRSS